MCIGTVHWSCRTRTEGTCNCGAILRKSKIIVYVLSNWKQHFILKTAKPGIEKDELTKFCHEHKGGNIFKQKYHLETICVPGSEPSSVLCQIESGKIGAFQAIDEWHHQTGHLGQECTYYNVNQAIVTIYCKACLTCMKKNPVTKQQKGSQKPTIIISE